MTYYATGWHSITAVAPLALRHHLSMILPFYIFLLIITQYCHKLQYHQIIRNI